MANYSQKQIASIVAGYWFISISMVYLNKVLMSSPSYSIDAPLFVTWFQCVVTCLICIFAGKMGSKYQLLPTTSSSSDASSSADVTTKTSTTSSFWSQFPKAEYQANVAQKVFPLSVVFVGMITFNNLCLKWVEVSFYNVARSLTIVFNVILSYLLLGQPSSKRTLLCLLFVISGFFIGSSGEVNFSLHGTLAGIMSSLFVSLNSIFTKKVLPAVDDNHWKLTYYNNVNAVLLFTPLIAYFELPVLVEAVDGQLVSIFFWVAMTIAGFFGFSIGIITVLQIKATSPLTHNISGTAKAALQSMLAFYLWGNAYTVKAILGIFIVLGGSSLYTLVKMGEHKRKNMLDGGGASKK